MSREDLTSLIARWRNQSEWLSLQKDKKGSDATDFCIADLEHLLASDAGKEMATVGWMPIESAPKDRTPILMITDYGKMATVYWDGDDSWRDWMRCNHTYGGVTHWMPLPPKPQ